MAEKPATELTNMEFDEVSLVTTPANQHAEITLAKSADEAFDIFDGMFAKSSPAPGDVHADSACECGGDGCGKCGVKKSFAQKVKDFFYGESDEVEKAGFTPPPGIGYPAQQQPQMQQPATMGVPQQQPAGQVPQGAIPPTNAPQMPATQQTQSGPPLPAEVVDYVRQLEEQIRVLQSQSNQTSHAQPTKEDDVDPFGKSEDYLSDDEVSFLRDIAKSLDDERQSETISKALEAVSKAEERAEKAMEIAKAEREARINHGFVELAKGYENLPVDPEEFAPVLKSIYGALDEEQVEIFSKVLDAADDALGASFAEYGSEMVGESEVLDAIGKSYSGGLPEGMTQEQAISKMFEDNPDMYDEYLAERGA